MQSFQNGTLRLWSVRLLLAALLMTGCELLLWPVSPFDRSMREWLYIIPAYTALAILALDLMARYRVRDIIDVMTVAGIVGLLVGLIVNPETSFIEFPRTLLTRVIGGYVALSLGMIGVWVVLTAGQFPRYRVLLIGYAVFGGFYWGTWMRWSPELTNRLDEAVSLGDMALAGGGFLALILALYAAVLLLPSGDKNGPDTLILSPAAFGILTAALLVLFMIRAVEQVGGRSVIDGPSLSMIAGLVAFCMTILWFRRPNKPRQLLDAHIPPTPLSPLWVFWSLAVFAGVTIMAYDLPRLDFMGVNQLTLMEWGFTGFATVWLPIVTAQVGLRAMTRLTAWRGGN